MSRTIPDETLQKLAESLKKHCSAKKCYASQRIMHVKTSDSHLSEGYIVVAKGDDPLLRDYNVLLEYPEAVDCVRFVLQGYDFALEQLAREFGGTRFTTGYWVLYDESGKCSCFGYKDRLPTAEEIIKCVESIYE